MLSEKFWDDFGTMVAYIATIFYIILGVAIEVLGWIFVAVISYVFWKTILAILALIFVAGVIIYAEDIARKIRKKRRGW